ncbi:MAG: TIM barrel protein [Candidatus Staskawiczbacteria bacterium]|nr:TIM barrel protein [Candidatus Staskawiczbacteria bacterium]
MIKYGFKIWSTDKKEMFSTASQLFKKGQIDFIELYIIPNSVNQKNGGILDILRGVPTTIHAPHSAHNFDVFWLNDSDVELFKNQILKTADFLGSKFIVVHAESGDSYTKFKKNIAKIKDKRILIENMPKFDMEKNICFGHSFLQLKFFKDCGFDICLDFGHATRSAVSQKIDYKEFIKKIILELNPSYFHICNGKLDENEDHRDLFDGEFDVKWMKNILLSLAKKKNIYLVFETPKGKNGLENDIKNINYFNSI